MHSLYCENIFIFSEEDNWCEAEIKEAGVWNSEICSCLEIHLAVPAPAK